MRMATTLDMQYSISSRYLEACDLVIGGGYKETEKQISDVETMKLF